MKGFNPLCEVKKDEGRDRKVFVDGLLTLKRLMGHNSNTKTSVESSLKLHFHPLI